MSDYTFGKLIEPVATIARWVAEARIGSAPLSQSVLVLPDGSLRQGERYAEHLSEELTLEIDVLQIDGEWSKTRVAERTLDDLDVRLLRVPYAGRYQAISLAGRVLWLDESHSAEAPN